MILNRFHNGNSGNMEIDDAVRQLVNAQHFTAGTIITMPVTYPSGSSVTLEVINQDGRCFVSDRGCAHDEAEMMGTVRYFKAEATRVAEHVGIKFDGQFMFVAEVPIDNVRGALVTVANASADSARAAASKQAENIETEAKEMLYERLSGLYTTSHVDKDAELVGQSNHKWRISVLVRDRAVNWMFEPVSGHYITAVGTAAKFHDFARLQNPPNRIAVIKSQIDLGDYYGLIAGSANKMITISAPDNEYLSILRAA